MKFITFFTQSLLKQKCHIFKTCIALNHITMNELYIFFWYDKKIICTIHSLCKAIWMNYTYASTHTDMACITVRATCFWLHKRRSYKKVSWMQISTAYCFAHTQIMTITLFILCHTPFQICKHDTLDAITMKYPWELTKSTRHAR